MAGCLSDWVTQHVGWRGGGGGIRAQGQKTYLSVSMLKSEEIFFYFKGGGNGHVWRSGFGSCVDLNEPILSPDLNLSYKGKIIRITFLRILK